MNIKTPVGIELPPQLIITWASASGKTTILKGLIEKYPNYFAKPIQYTTRPARWDWELDEYVFVTPEQFMRKLINWDFIEFVEYNKELYAIGKYFDQTKSNIFIAEPVGRAALERYFKLNKIKFVEVYTSIPVTEMRKRLELRRGSVIEVDNRMKDLEYFHPTPTSLLVDWTDRLPSVINQVARFTWASLKT